MLTVHIQSSKGGLWRLEGCWVEQTCGSAGGWTGYSVEKSGGTVGDKDTETTAGASSADALSTHPEIPVGTFLRRSSTTCTLRSLHFLPHVLCISVLHPTCISLTGHVPYCLFVEKLSQFYFSASLFCSIWRVG